MELMSHKPRPCPAETVGLDAAVTPTLSSVLSAPTSTAEISSVPADGARIVKER